MPFNDQLSLSTREAEVLDRSLSALISNYSTLICNEMDQKQVLVYRFEQRIIGKIQGKLREVFPRPLDLHGKSSAFYDEDIHGKAD